MNNLYHIKDRIYWIIISVCTSSKRDQSRKQIFLFIFIFALIAQDSAGQDYTGFQIAGLPTASYKDGEGYSAGGNLFLFQYGDGHRLPYFWSFELGFKISTEGMLSSDIFFDVPHILGHNSRFNLFIEYKRYLVDDYYGLGNAPDYNPDYIDPDKPGFRDKLFYSFKQRWPNITISAQFPTAIRNTRHLLSLSYSQRHIELYSKPNRLSADQPLGVQGGRTSALHYGLVYDSRDQEAVPRSGAWSEVLAMYAAPFLGSDYHYLRLTMTDRRYFSLHPRIVYAQRLILEPVFGDVPFYDMAMINGSFERHLGLGGDSSLRGVPRLLFVGQHKVLGNFELRFETASMTILKQDLTFFIHTFLDAGRVWLKDDPLVLDDIHSSYGAGLHVLWKKDLVGAIDVGRSRYSDMAIYITFRNLF